MEAKELKITIPENHEIDWQKSAKQEKIVFKKKNNLPRSWKEYLELNTGFDGAGIDWNMSGGVQATGLHHRGKAIVPTHLAQPFIAMMQLMSLRQEWIGDWEPDWSKETSHKNPKYCIIPTVSEGFSVGTCYNNWIQTLSFPTKEMAVDFMNTFKDLLNVAKPLI